MRKTNDLDLSAKFYMTMKRAMKLPGVKISRNNFLSKELEKRFGKEVADNAIATTPAEAGLTIEDIEPIAKSCIDLETRNVTGLSTLAGMPGGLVMAGTVPADIVQYYGHIMRILQKLIYLYGWQEIVDAETELEDEVQNVLTLFIGVMFGVQGASKAISNLAASIASKVEKELMKKALTKGTVYPIVKKVSTTLGYKMTKEVFSKSIAKVVPIVGGIVSGGFTLATFLPSARRLEGQLKTLPLADVEQYVKTEIVEL